MNHFVSLVSLAGTLLANIPVRSLPVDRSKSTSAPELSHLVMVVDRSGSMYSDMDAMRKMIKQVLTIEDFRDANLLISLVSYSSSGDTQLHFGRVKVGDIMKPASKEQAEIDRLRATALTCISGGLLQAEKLIKKDETTCILVHTDGYANDPSPYSEQRAIAQVVDRLSAMGNVVVNTIAYSWADFSLLDMIATRCGGSCVQAKTTKDVHTAIHNSVAAMAGRIAPAIRLEASGTIFAFSKSARKVMVGQNELLLRGLGEADDVSAFVAGESIAPTMTGQLVPQEVALALARVELAGGRLNRAKEIVLGSRNSNLYPHLRALTSAQLGEFASALEKAIFDGPLHFVETYGIASNRPTVVEIVNLLNAFSKDWQVNVPAFRANYTRRSLKRVAGIRNKDGTITVPKVRTAAKHAEWLGTTGFEMNRTSATINMRVTMGQSLFEQDREITEVSGIPLDLKAYNNYTIVGDGTVNIRELTIRVLNKKLSKRLNEMGFPTVEGTITLPLGELDVVPVSDIGDELMTDDQVVSKLLAIRVVTSLIAAATKGQSDKYTPEQVAALKAVYLTPALNVSLPTTVHYADKDDAVAKGLIDSYTSYRIEVGSTNMPVLSDALSSANDFLKRFFEVVVEGKKVAKPSMLDATNPKSVCTPKTPKTVDAGDQAQLPWFTQFLGTESTGPWNEFLTLLGLEEDEIGDFLQWRKLDADRRVEMFKAVLRRTEEFSNNLFAQTLAPTVIYMGATGFLPSALQAQATMMAPEDFEAKYKAKLSKELKEATFFVLPGDRVLSVRPETVWYTTPAGLASVEGDADEAA